MRLRIGKVAALARYAVKSMLSRQLEEVEFTDRGAIGDRVFALRAIATGGIASAKKFGRLRELRVAAACRISAAGEDSTA